MTWSQAGCVGAVLALLLTSAATASDVDATNYTGPSKSEAREIVLGELARRNIQQSDVRHINIVSILKFVGEDEIVDGFNAWVRVKGCDTGFVVVQLNRNGFIMQSYTSGDCNPPGFDS